MCVDLYERLHCISFHTKGKLCAELISSYEVQCISLAVGNRTLTISTATVKKNDMSPQFRLETVS